MPSNIQGVYDDEHNRRRLTPNMYRVESSTQLEAPSATGENPSTDVPQNRWRYSLKPAFPHRSGADLTADPVVIKLADTVSDLEEVFGFNIYEIQNDDQTIFGIARATIPTGFTLQPVPDGSLVVAYFGTSEEQFGETYEPAACCYFWWPNQYAGAC